MHRLFLAVAVVALLGLAGPAAAATTYPEINALLSETAQRQVQAVCHTPEEWAALGVAEGFDPTQLLGFVTFWSYRGGPYIPEPVSHQAPGICERAEAFRLSPTRETQKMCQEGYDEVPRVEYRMEERTRYETRVKYVPSKRWVTVVRHGKSAKVLRPYRKRVEYQVRVVYTIEVPVTVVDQVPRIAVCADWGAKTKALHVMIHETGHMARLVRRAADRLLGDAEPRLVRLATRSTARLCPRDSGGRVGVVLAARVLRLGLHSRLEEET